MSAVLAEKAAKILDTRENERAKTVKLFHRNAAIKHGIPWEDMDRDSATTTTKTENTELAIIDKVVDKLIDKIGTQPDEQPAIDTDKIAADVTAKIPSPKNGRDGADGRDGRDGKDADPQAVADLVAKQLAAQMTQPQPPSQATSSKWPDWAKAAVVALGSGALAAPIGYYLAGGDDKPPPAVNQPAPEKTGSLLQYLEDNGYSVGDSNGN